MFNSDLAFPGYTLFSNNSNTYLIDNCGYKIQTWESDYRPGASIYLLENGDLFRTRKITGDFTSGGFGGGFERFDWDNNLLWSINYYSYDFHPHHDVAILPNGNFLALFWEKVSAAEAIALGRQLEEAFWTEVILEIMPIGENEFEIVWRWDVTDHLIQDHDVSKQNFGLISDHPELVNLNFDDIDGDTSTDWLHMNAIDYNAELDQIALSIRNFNEIWIIDHSTTTEEAASHSGGNSGKGGDLLYRYGNPAAYNRGTVADRLFNQQHDVNWIPPGFPNEGQLMVFNNLYTEVSSSVERWQPPLQSDGSYALEQGESYGPSDVEWRYTGENLFASRISGARQLPNGHVLICDGGEGRIFEVNQAGQLVWDYVNPANSGGFPTLQGLIPQQNTLFRAHKYPADYPAFDSKDMTQGEPVELNPVDYNCSTSTNISETQNQAAAYKLLTNLIQDQLQLWVLGPCQALIFDSSGKQHKQLYLNSGDNQLLIHDLASGIYFLQMQIDNDVHTRRFCKL